MVIKDVKNFGPSHNVSGSFRGGARGFRLPFTKAVQFLSIHTYIYVYEIYNALHSRGWLESEARAVARWRGLGRNGREVEYVFNLRLNVLMVGAFLTV